MSKEQKKSEELEMKPGTIQPLPELISFKELAAALSLNGLRANNMHTPSASIAKMAVDDAEALIREMDSRK